jgi:hypothetical protein
MIFMIETPCNTWGMILAISRCYRRPLCPEYETLDRPIYRACIGSIIGRCVVFIVIYGCFSSSKIDISAFNRCADCSPWDCWFPPASFIEIEAVLDQINKN